MLLLKRLEIARHSRRQLLCVPAEVDAARYDVWARGVDPISTQYIGHRDKRRDQPENNNADESRGENDQGDVAPGHVVV